MSNRVSLSKKVRFDVFKRDCFECQYCGRHPPDIVLEVDHIIPVCDGGDNDVENLLTACFDCNRGKQGDSLTSIPVSLCEKAFEISEREEQIAGYREVLEFRKERIERDMWRVADALRPGSSENGIRRDWLLAIKRFNEQLDLYEVLDAAEIALARKPFSENWRFKYFCGICWNKIRGAEGKQDS